MNAGIAQHIKKAGKLSRETLSLLAFVCGRDLSWIIAHPEYRLKDKERKIFNKKYIKLQKGWPLAYLLESKNFYNHAFRVTPAVLIPRPESEKIIEIGLENLQSDCKRERIFLDLGTGSGALIVSLAAAIKKARPDIYEKSNFWASDISGKALKVASFNANRCRLSKKIKFKRGNLLLPWRFEIKNFSQSPIFIAANLPYLKPLEREREKSIAHEPSLALIGGNDGLDLYRRLLAQVQKLKTQAPLHLIMEINPAQAASLVKEAKKYFQDAEIKKTPDLSGRTRFIELYKK